MFYLCQINYTEPTMVPTILIIAIPPPYIVLAFSIFFNCAKYFDLSSTIFYIQNMNNILRIPKELEKILSLISRNDITQKYSICSKN